MHTIKIAIDEGLDGGTPPIEEGCHHKKPPRSGPGRREQEPPKGKVKSPEAMVKTL